MKKVIWNALVSAVTFVAAWGARELATNLWTRVSDTEGPVNPADKSVTWPAATGWALLAGAAGGLARVLGRRGSAELWEHTTGTPPPGLQTSPA